MKTQKKKCWNRVGFKYHTMSWRNEKVESEDVPCMVIHCRETNSVVPIICVYIMPKFEDSDSTRIRKTFGTIS